MTPEDNIEIPATEAEAYAIAHRETVDYAGDVDAKSKKQLVGQALLRIGSKFGFRDSETDQDVTGEVLEHDKEASVTTVQLSDREEPSRINTSLLRSASEYAIEHTTKEGVIVASTVSVALGTLYVLVKRRAIHND